MRYIYDRLRELAKFHALDTYLLYQAFKEVKEAKAPAEFIYEDSIKFQLPLGGQWPVVSMIKTLKKRLYIHFQTTGEEGDAYLCLRQDGAPFKFVTAPPLTQQHFQQARTNCLCTRSRKLGFTFRK